MRKATYGEATFFINKVSSPKLKLLLLKHVLPVLGSGANAELGDDDKESRILIKILLSTIHNFDADNYDTLINELHKAVKYTNPRVPQPHPLEGDTENAFDGLDMVHLLALDREILAENFMGSWAVIRSVWPSLTPILDYLSSQMSTLSLEIPSLMDSPDKTTSTD